MKTILVMARLTPAQVKLLDAEVKKLKVRSPEAMRVTRSHAIRHAIVELSKQGAA